MKAIQDQGQLKTIKKYDYDVKDTHLSQNKNKYLIKLQMKDLKE